jgi:hypothetical protein
MKNRAETCTLKNVFSKKNTTVLVFVLSVSVVFVVDFDWVLVFGFVAGSFLLFKIPKNLNHQRYFSKKWRSFVKS